MRIGSDLFKNPPCKAQKTLHIDVLDSFARMQLHQFTLRLHGELLRNDHNKLPLWLPHGLLYDFFIKCIRFSTA